MIKKIHFVKVSNNTEPESASDFNSWTFCSLAVSLRVPLLLMSSANEICCYTCTLRVNWAFCSFQWTIGFLVVTARGKKYLGILNICHFHVVPNEVSHDLSFQVVCCNTANHLGIKLYTVHGKVGKQFNIHT